MSEPTRERADFQWHLGRSWEGHLLEDACSCIKEPCGLVGMGIDLECDQHAGPHARSMRQIHWADECPGKR